MASVLKEYKNCGSSDEEEDDFISGMAQKIAAIKPPSESIKVGTVAMVHSLQSAGVEKLTGAVSSSCVIILSKTDGKFA